VATGAIRPVIDCQIPLAEAEKALFRMQERLHLGKILLEVPQTQS
jgi:NADPH:quinone reductase-like Zn-dependent oxidoreductase